MKARPDRPQSGLARVVGLPGAFILSGILVLALIAGGMLLLRARSTTPKVRGETSSLTAPAVVTVSVAPAAQRCFEEKLGMAGVVVPRQEVEVRPDVEGLRVSRVVAELLAKVEQGQVLAQLVPADGRAAGPIMLRSPVAGIVGKSTAAVGTLASPSQGPALFHIIARGEMDFLADVPAPSLARLSLDQPVYVSPLGGGGVEGRIRAVSTAVDPITQLGRARVSLATDTGLLWGGFSRGTVEIGRRCGLAVPSSAVLRRPEGSAVYVVRETVVEARPVVVGLSTGDEVEVRSGLNPSELIVQRAGPFLREGDTVRTVPGAGSAAPS